MPYKITNISNTPISINSPSTMEDDLYLHPGQYGFLKNQPALGILWNKVIVESIVDYPELIASKLSLGLDRVANLTPEEMPVSYAQQDALTSASTAQTNALNSAIATQQTSITNLSTTQSTALTNAVNTLTAANATQDTTLTNATTTCILTAAIHVA